MQIPFHVFLIIYIIVTVIGLLFAGFNFYHVFRYAFRTAVSIIVTGFYTVGFILILGISIVFITRVDWSQTLTVGIGF